VRAEDRPILEGLSRPCGLARREVVEALGALPDGLRADLGHPGTGPLAGTLGGFLASIRDEDRNHRRTAEPGARRYLRHEIAPAPGGTGQCHRYHAAAGEGLGDDILRGGAPPEC
jgi:hypothetical protein